jgi:hypothetical protein
LPSEQRNWPQRRQDQREPARSTFAGLDRLSHGGIELEPVAASWDFVAFRLSEGPRQAVVCVPEGRLPVFTRLVRGGALDDLLRAYLDVSPQGRSLRSYRQVSQPAFYDDVSVSNTLLPGDRYGVGGGPIVRGRPGKVLLPPPEDGGGGGGIPWIPISWPPRRWIPIGIGTGLIVTIITGLIVFGGGGSGVSDEPTTVAQAPTPTLPAVAVAPSPTTQVEAPPTTVVEPPTATTVVEPPTPTTVAAPPTQAPPTPVPATVLTPQQLTSANLTTADAAVFYGGCGHEFTVQNDGNVQQAVSSSPPMMQAMGAAGYTGFRSVSRAPAPCPQLPYNVATVMGNARSQADAEALFDAAVLNYGQVLFTNVATFGLGGGWDESHCQSGVYPPAGNIIAVACWVRKGAFVGGSFVLLPPGSSQAAINKAASDSAAFWQRVAAIAQ